MDVVLRLEQAAPDIDGLVGAEDVGAGGLGEVEVRLAGLNLQRDDFGAERPRGDRVEVAALEIRVAGDAAVRHAPVDRGDDLDPARPVLRGDHPFDRSLVMVGHADEATTAQAGLPPGQVSEAHRPGEERVANVVLVAVLEQFDVVQADRVVALDPQLEHEPVGQVDEVLVEDGTPAHKRRLAVVAAVRVRPRVMGATRVLPLGRAACAEVAVAGRGQGLAQALPVGLEVVVGDDRLVGALAAHRASVSRNRSTSSIESSTNAADVPRPPISGSSAWPTKMPMPLPESARKASSSVMSSPR